MAEARRRRSRLLLSLLLVLASALVVEGLVRARQWMTWGTASATFYRFTLDPQSGLRIPAPGVTEGTCNLIHVNSRGFRGPEIEEPKPAGRLRVAFLGGSTTFCAEASDDAHTWPALVVEGLARRFPERSFDLVNGGAGGFTVEQSRTNLRARVAPLAPDVVVIYHATNDLTADTRSLARAQGLPGADDHEPSWLSERSLAWMLVEKNWAAWRAGSGDAGGRELVYDAPSLAQGFGDRLEGLVREAQASSPVVVLATFSHQQRREQDEETRRQASSSSLHYMPFLGVDAILAGFDAYNEAIAEVGRRTGVVLVTGELEIPGDPEHFADSVHFTDAGCRLQAERVLVALAGAPAFSALLESRR